MGSTGFLLLVLLASLIDQIVDGGDATKILIDRSDQHNADLWKSLDISKALRTSYENQKPRHIEDLVTTLFDKYHTPIKKKCRAGTNDAEKISSRFVQAWGPNRWQRDGSNCPVETWLSRWAEYDLLVEAFFNHEMRKIEAGGSGGGGGGGGRRGGPHRVQYSRHKKLLINVGFNKGYNFAIWSNLFASWSGLNPATWHQLIMRMRPGLKSDAACGAHACADCRAKFSVEPSLVSQSGQMGNISRGDSIVMIGVDMNNDNVEMVGNITDFLYGHDTPLLNLRGVDIHLVDAAISDKNGSMELPICPLTDEECALGQMSPLQESLKEKKKLVYKKVDILAIDDVMRMVREKGLYSPLEAENERSRFNTWFHRRLMRRHGVLERKVKIGGGGDDGGERVPPTGNATLMTDFPLPPLHKPLVDILMIDTEGNDPKALQGASQLLAGKGARVVIFEYHRNGEWGRWKEGVTLEKSINELDKWGYDCYWQGNARLWPITGCYHAKYETHNWSNVMCVLRGDFYHNAVQSLVVDPHTLK